MTPREATVAAALRRPGAYCGNQLAGEADWEWQARAVIAALDMPAVEMKPPKRRWRTFGGPLWLIWTEK